MNNKAGNKLKSNSNDIIYTPKPIALLMIKLCKIKNGSKVLDPSKGGGVFYDNLPNNCIKDYCEITENKDFFDYHDNVDLIIGKAEYGVS
jgi:type I restriction-modification system DNA methylase subunit